MLYQKLLTGNRPYFLTVLTRTHFQKHRHPEIELNYCLEGSYDIIIDGATYTMHAGDLAIVGSLISHEFPTSLNIVNVTLEIGPVFLKEYFQHFLKASFAPIYHLQSGENDTPVKKELRRLFTETAGLHTNRDEFSELMILGNIYKITAHVAREFTSVTRLSPAKKQNLETLACVEKALELIYSQYAENLTVDMVAKLTGYGKSNFCKHFKNITGESFHYFLNHHRVETACYYLSETNNTLTEIATAVGFADSKVLCRVFKSYLGVTPGEYRQQYAQRDKS